MKIHVEAIPLETGSRFEVLDITRDVEEAVERSGVRSGHCVVYVPHTTATIVVNEAERGLLEDLVTWLKEHFQPERAWSHNRIDNNAHAHLAAAVTGPSRFIPISEGKLMLGTWQRILFVEMDGPRKRRVIVEVMGE